MKALACRLIVAALLVPAAIGAADASCTDAPPRLVTLDTAKVEGFGLYEKFPPLPLEDGEFVLTLDDGPNPETTPQILAILKERCIPATFFVVGKKVEAHGEILRDIKNAGFGIGNHSYSHRSLGKLPLDDALSDIARAQAAITDASGEAPRFLRFPSGSKTPELFLGVRHLGMTVASVDISPEDWRGEPAAVSLERFLTRMTYPKRGVILLHDSQPNTVQLLPMVLDDIERRGGRFVRLEAAGRAGGL